MKRVLALALVACTPTPAPTTSTATNDAATPIIDAGDRPAPAASAEPTTAAPDPEPAIEEIARVLAVDASACTMAGEARVRCLYDQRYRGDAKAAGLAYELYVKWKIVAGVERAHTMDGGYRGMIKIEPATPINADRMHLEWIVDSFRDFDRFFEELVRYGHDAGVTSSKKLYRWRPITLRFFKSTARTPSAYANDWEVAYNLLGSLNKTADAVRETFFHELFHLNDYARPPRPDSNKPWCAGPLRPLFDSISTKCGTAIPCLGPFTPTDTVVRGGTYYAFQPGNGLPGVEYAAELATRYYREQRAALRGVRTAAKPFKCGPLENAEAWEAMGAEWFGGIDAVPPCH